MKPAQARTVAEVVVISDDDDEFGPSSTPVQASSRPRRAQALSDAKRPPARIADDNKKTSRPKFLTAATTSRSTPVAKTPNVSPRVVSISSSEDEAADERPMDPLLYSPVKTSHKKDVIDLTLSSSDDDEGSDSDLDERDVISLLEESPPRLKRLIKGSRIPEDAVYPEHPSEHSQTYKDLPPLCASADTGDEPKSPLGSSLAEPHTYPQPSLNNLPEFGEMMPPTCIPDKAKMPEPQPSETLGDSDSDYPPILKSRTARAVSPAKKGRTPRVSKKALQAAEQERRETYAQRLFNELNQSVFKGGLPEETALKWSNRLLTTAGRARWRRSRDGSQTTEIELATKILDCDERIRNTLSHEMCHLACWIINGDPKEGHGRAFKAWAAKVTKKRPEIVVSTRHNYEINYPYEWECDHCAKVYGRYSKSIKPDECRCGTCKVGKLVPLFTTRAVKSPTKTKIGGQMPAPRLDGSHVVHTLAKGVLDLTLDENSEETTPEGQQKKVYTTMTPPLGDIEAQLESLTVELGRVDMFRTG